MLVKDPDAIPDRWGKRPSDRSVGELLSGGVIILDKPSGPTSHQATAWVRDALRCEKVGHGGTLDPYVSGVLPIRLSTRYSLLIWPVFSLTRVSSLSRPLSEGRAEKTCVLPRSSIGCPFSSRHFR